MDKIVRLIFPLKNSLNVASFETFCYLLTTPKKDSLAFEVVRVMGQTMWA